MDIFTYEEYACRHIKDEIYNYVLSYQGIVRSAQRSNILEEQSKR